jgi:hypothetical protein
MFEVEFSIRDMFFDRIAVLARLDRAEQRELSRIGAFVRKRGRSLLRKRKRVSAPGEVPSVHSSDNRVSLRNILFGYDARIHGVVIGPVRLNQVNLTDTGRVSIPSLMEFGGHVNIHEEQYRNTKTPDKWYRRDFRVSKSPWKKYRIRRANYAARPFMGRALQEEVQAGTIRDVWVSSLERMAA